MEYGWNPMGVRTKGRPKNGWRVEVINDVKKEKLRNWSQIVKARKAWNDLGIEDPNPRTVYCQEKKKKEKKKNIMMMITRRRRTRRRSLFASNYVYMYTLTCKCVCTSHTQTLYMCVYLCVCVYIYIYIYADTYLHTFVHKYEVWSAVL